MNAYLAPAPRRRWRPYVLLAAVTAAVLAPSAVPALAAPVVTVSPSSALPGATVTVTGFGFPTFGGNQVRVEVATTLVATVPYQPPDFTATFAAPNLSPGRYPVTACIAVGGVCSSAPGTSAQGVLRILAPPPTTPPTTKPPVVVPPPPPPTPPVGPTDLEIDIDPVCCDPPYPEDPRDLLGPPVPTPGPGLLNPGPEQSFPDLYIWGIEVTQNVQNINSEMPLVAGRKTWVRVHPRANTDSWAPIDGAILVQHGDQEEILYPVNGPVATGLGVDRADPNSALNFVLAPKWYAEGTLKITALVWAFNPSTLDNQEPNPQNNLMTQVVQLRPGRNMVLNLVPLDDGAGPGPSPTLGWTVFSALYVANDIVRYHPIAGTDLTLYPIPIGPGTGLAGGLTTGGEPQFDLTTPAGRRQPLHRLFWYHQVLGLPDDERLIGMFDKDIYSGGVTGSAVSDLRSSWTMPKLGTPAHEAAHLTGRGHVDCTGSEEKGGGLDKTHPNAAPNCSLAPVSEAGYFGLTIFDTPLTIYSNDPDHPQAAFPLMSYKEPKWNDPYHWCKMLTFYGVDCSPEQIGVPGKPIPTPTHIDVDCDESVEGPGGIGLMVCLTAGSPPVYDEYPELPATQVARVVPTQPQAWVLVTGTLSDSGGTIGRATLVDELSPALAELAGANELAAIASGGGADEIVVRDAEGGVLARVKVSGVRPAGHGEGGTDDDAEDFVAVIPVAGEFEELTLVHEGFSRRHVAVSPQPPTISGLVATPGDDGVRITWRAADPDGDPVTASVLWSADGTTWIPIALDTALTSVLVGPGVALPGGDQVRVKVIANDGVRTSEAVSAPFALPTKAPAVAVGELPDGSRIPRYYLGELTALGYDPEDGQLPGSAIAWHSDLDGDLGTGTALSLRWLSAGEHTISATATDSAGTTATDTIRLTVVDTGAPAPRVQGAEPDAERRLREAAAGDGFDWWWALLAGGVAMAGAAGIWLARRRRARARVAG